MKTLVTLMNWTVTQEYTKWRCDIEIYYDCMEGGRITCATESLEKLIIRRCVKQLFKGWLIVQNWSWESVDEVCG